MERLARGDRAEKEVMVLEANERLVRWVVGRGRGGPGRLFEASERVVSAGKEGRRVSIYSTTLVDRKAWVGEEQIPRPRRERFCLSSAL